MSSEKPLSAINFFVCSTFLDLKAYRDAVIKNLQSHAGVINAQEFFGARDQKPLATCLACSQLGLQRRALDVRQRLVIDDHERRELRQPGLGALEDPPRDAHA